MAPNTNVKAVALFGVSAKDLELIGAGPTKNFLAETSISPQRSPSQEAVIDSDSYWEDPADTLLTYHGVTVDRMEARQKALARVVQRLEERRAFEVSAKSSNDFSANVIIEQLEKDALRREQQIRIEKPNESESYWDESNDTVSRGLVSSLEVDCDSYWLEPAHDEEDKQMTAQQLARRRETILRVQQECRLRSRLSEFASASHDDHFSASYLVGRLQNNAQQPISVARENWDW